MFRNKSKALKILYFFLILFSILILLTSQSLHFKIGDIFFGGVPKLYNINLAQYFFYKASHPLIGKAAPYSNHQLSRTYFIKGKLEDSLITARKELELYPKHTETYYIIGLTLGYLNREEEAILAFSKYIEHHPNTWAARNDKAWLQFRIGDIDGALETIEPVAKSYRYTPWIQNTYCALLIAKKRYQEALSPCTNAMLVTEKMDENDWGRAYPGNDPRVYATGLTAMKTSIRQNLELINKNINNKND